MHKLQATVTLLLACLGAALLVLIVYLPGLPGMFVFDDIANIVQNPALHIRDLGASSLFQAMLSSPGGGLMRPLSMLSFALDYYLWGLSPAAFKLTNILIHIACGVSLGFVARELLLARAEDARDALPRREIAWLSLGVALLWAVHPLNLTSVLYAVQRDTALAALFSALAMLAYLAGRRRERQGRNGAWLIWFWTPLATVAGILCKENAALVPVFLLLIEWTVLGFRGAGGRTSRPTQAFFGAFLLLPGIGVVALAVLHPATLFASYAGRDYGMVQRLLSESRILLDYLRWAVLPDLRQLGLFHDDIVFSQGLFEPASTLLSCIAIALLLGAAVAIRKRVPLLSLGILWFFAGHLIESTVLPLELAFEHRNYLPLFGLIFGATATLYIFARRRGESRLVVAMLVIGSVAMAAATAVRASDWGDELSFARSEARHHPDSPRALAELEWAYMNYVVTTHERSVVPLAVQAAARSKQADGFSINQDVSLAYMYSQLGDLTQARDSMTAAAEGASSAHISSTLQFSLQTLIDMATPANQSLFPAMDAVFENALDNPRLNTDACYTANVLNSQSLYRNGTQDIPGALASSHRAVQLCPHDAQLHANFARLLLRYRDLKDAKLELDALRALHDVRRDAELRELQAQYDAGSRQRPPGRD
jgi:hypothetical protein